MWMGIVAVVLAAVVLTGCGGAGGGAGPRGIVRSIDSSWVPGQASLVELDAFQAIADRALALAQQRVAERKRELALLEARRVAARKRASEEARRRYLEALREARRKYREALRKAAIERAKALAKLRREQQRIARLRREALAKRRVGPGEECREGSVQARYRCRTGLTPVPTEKKK